MISNHHFNQILLLSDSLNAAPTSQEDTILPLFMNYLQNAIILTKFIKSLKGQADEHLKLLSQQAAAAKKLNNLASLKSPERQAKTVQSTQNTQRSQQSKLRSPDSKNDFKSELNAELYRKETEELIQSQEKKLQLDLQKHNLVGIQMSINKIRFDMEREEKLAIKSVEQIEQKRDLEFQKEQMEKDRLLAEEREKKEREDFLQRQKELVEEQARLKEIKKSEEQKLIQESIDHDFEKQREYKQQLEKKKREAELDQVQLNQIALKDKEKKEKEEYKQDKLKEQREREEERKK